MRIPKTDSAGAEVDMTPMIDIVFQLIAFFMVISNFEQTEADERVKLPQDTLAMPPKVKPEHELVLNVGFHRDENNNLPEQGPVVFHGGEFCWITQRDCPASVRVFDKRSGAIREYKTVDFNYRLEQEKRLYYDRGISVADQVTVVIRADTRVATGLIQKLIQLAQGEFAGSDGSTQAGFAMFALKAEQTSETQAPQTAEP